MSALKNYSYIQWEREKKVNLKNRKDKKIFSDSILPHKNKNREKKNIIEKGKGYRWEITSGLLQAKKTMSVKFKISQ